MPCTDSTNAGSSGKKVGLPTNPDVIAMLADFLSNQHAFFASVSKEWNSAWGDIPKSTQAITADTTVSQLQCSFDSGLRNRRTICEHIADNCGVEILQCAYSNGCLLPR